MKKEHDIVGIAPALAGIFIPIVFFFLIFAKESAWVLGVIAFAFPLLGIRVAILQAGRNKSFFRRILTYLFL